MVVGGTKIPTNETTSDLAGHCFYSVVELSGWWGGILFEGRKTKKIGFRGTTSQNEGSRDWKKRVYKGKYGKAGRLI